MVLLGLAQTDCFLDGGGVHAVDGADDVPAVGFEALGDVLGEGDVGVAFDGDVIVVVEIDELTELERSRQRRRLGGDAFLQVAVGDDGVGVVVDEPVAVLVVAPSEPPLGDGHADAVGEALAEGAGGRLDAGGVAKFGVARRPAPPLTELPEVVERDVVAGEVQERVEHRRGVPRRQDETVAVGPGGIAGVVLEEAVPEDVGHRRGAHRRAGMARLGPLDLIDGEEAHRVDAQLIEFRVMHGVCFPWVGTRPPAPLSSGEGWGEGAGGVW